jgi:Fructose-2,6-bisphosphatase
MRVRLIRHGMTAGNSERRYIGVTDEPLCAEGRAAAQRHEKDRSLEFVYVSPLKRARETASILFPNAAQAVVNALREMDFGAFENRSADEMEHDPAYRAWVDGMCLGPCPGGESQAAFFRRTAGAFTAIVRQAEGDVTVVTHGGVVASLMVAFGEPKRPFYEWLVDNLAGFCADCTLKSGLPVLTDIRPIQ